MMRRKILGMAVMSVLSVVIVLAVSAVGRNGGAMAADEVSLGARRGRPNSL